MSSSFSDWSRRSFLKAGLAASALPTLPRSLASQASQRYLPAIPTVKDLAGSRLVHAWRDLYQSPTTQNEYGYVQASKSVSGLTALSLPPFACCGVPDMMGSPGFLLTCELFLNERVLLSSSRGGDTIAYQWFPHRFVRESRVDGSNSRLRPLCRRSGALPRNPFASGIWEPR
jgi:TAT (twin-arginine translocation) pathway signal sequence